MGKPAKIALAKYRSAAAAKEPEGAEKLRGEGMECLRHLNAQLQAASDAGLFKSESRLVELVVSTLESDPSLTLETPLSAVAAKAQREQAQAAANREQLQHIQGQFYVRLRKILNQNDIKFQDEVIGKLVMRYSPDWRRLINECQRHAAAGEINVDILADIADIKLDDLVKAMKNKEFTTIKRWVTDNIDNDPNIVMRKIYDVLYANVKPKYIPEAVLIIAKYQYQIAFVADQEINLLACLTEVMLGCEFK